MSGRFSRFSSTVARWTGSVWAFVLVGMAIVLWLAVGPFFHWSGRWQLTAATTATLVTFLMVFVIQATQNRHTAAMQLKLDELILATENARENVMGAERLTDKEIQGQRDELHERA